EIGYGQRHRQTTRLEWGAHRQQRARQPPGRPRGCPALAPDLRRGAARVTADGPAPTPPPPTEPDHRSVADLVFDVSEHASVLVREEIELAKAEISEKVGKLLRGSVVGVAAGVFAFLALILVMEGIAWLLNEQVFDNSWAGFFVEAALFL